MQETTYKFIPDQELLDFAEWISREYKNLAYDIYYSKKGSYAVNYVQVGEDSATAYWVSRVDTETGIIEIQKDVLLLSDQYTPDFVFYDILWHRCLLEIRISAFPFYNRHLQSDFYTLEYYLTTGRSKKNLYNGILEHLKIHANEFNSARLLIIAEKIKKQQDGN